MSAFLLCLYLTWEDLQDLTYDRMVCRMPSGGTFHLDESTTTTTLPSIVPRSTRPLRRNSTTLVKHNLSSSITIHYPYHQLGHGDIDTIISQLLVDLLTLRLQRLPTKSRLGCTSSSRCIIILATNNQKIPSAQPFSGMQKLKQPKQKTKQ